MLKENNIGHSNVGICPIHRRPVIAKDETMRKDLVILLDVPGKISTRWVSVTRFDFNGA